VKKNSILLFLVIALMIVPLSKIAFTQKEEEAYFHHMYGEDDNSWDKARDKLRENSDIILTIYFHMPCIPKQGFGKGMIGFWIGKNNELLPPIYFPTGLPGSKWFPKAQFTTIPVNYKCGVYQASGTIHIYIKGKIIKRGKKKFLRFDMYRKWDCVIKSDFPQYAPFFHGKKCVDPPEDYGDYEIPLKNGYITNYSGSIYNFSLEIINK